jgi:hypothetical protein
VGRDGPLIAASTDVVEPFHEFFLASAGVAGALIGLLFVAISVAPDRVTGEGADPAHRIRASAALTAFTNALTISLFALIPDFGLGVTAIIVGVLGLIFVAGSSLSVVRLRHSTAIRFRDVSFLVGQAVVFVVQIVAGAQQADVERTGAVETIAILTIVCFIIGISRAWELIGASRPGLRSEVATVIRERAHDEPGAPTQGSASD